MPTPAELIASAQAADANARALNIAASKAQLAEELNKEAAVKGALAVELEKAAAASAERASKEADEKKQLDAKAQAEKDAAEAKQSREASNNAAREAADATADAKVFARFASNPSIWADMPVSGKIWNAFTSLSTWVLICMGGIVWFLLNRVTDQSGNLLNVLATAANSRGLITFLITASTVSIAIMLIYQAFAEGTTGDNFRMAREVFASLVGVLGTIVGFYFGIANDGTKAASGLVMASVDVKGQLLGTIISGGTGQYHWRIEGDATSGVKVLEGNLEKAGALQFVLPEIKADGRVTLTVSDQSGSTVIATKDVKKTSPLPTPDSAVASPSKTSETPRIAQPDAPKTEDSKLKEGTK